MKNLMVFMLTSCLSIVVHGSTAVAPSEKSSFRILSNQEEDAFVKEVQRINKDFDPAEVIKLDAKTRSSYKNFIRVSQGLFSPTVEINGKIYSTGIVAYQPQRFEGDTCTSLPVEELKRRGLHPRSCAEGQIGHSVCDLTIVDTDLKVRAVHRFEIPGEVPGFPTNCQVPLGYGMGNRQTGSLLMTLRYGFTNRPLAGSIEAIGSNSFETTRLLRIREQDGKITVTEDNRCLGENNFVPDIPTARKLLRKCPIDMQ
ncbi:hypothetical protein [Limnohabitans sp.]|jgi:hypothetical protein|uniref:hypothetical protein n=1 Tax=Limnohabitans sp. TaxID=1907725 RepID=UPI0037BE5777